MSYKLSVGHTAPARVNPNTLKILISKLLSVFLSNKVSKFPLNKSKF